jgi:hypothetical protein
MWWMFYGWRIVYQMRSEISNKLGSKYGLNNYCSINSRHRSYYRFIDVRGLVDARTKSSLESQTHSYFRSR